MKVYEALIKSYQREADAFEDIIEYLRDYKTSLRIEGIHEFKRDYPLKRCIEIASDRHEALEDAIAQLALLKENENA